MECLLIWKELVMFVGCLLFWFVLLMCFIVVIVFGLWFILIVLFVDKGVCLIVGVIKEVVWNYGLDLVVVMVVVLWLILLVVVIDVKSWVLIMLGCKLIDF